MKSHLLTILTLIFGCTIAFGQVIYDFETPETSNTLTYFESGLNGTDATIIANPNASGINTSGMVVEYVKPTDAQPWAGAYFGAPQPMIDGTNGGQICIDVHMDHIGNVACKLEQSTNGGMDWVTSVANTKMNEWETLCFDLSAPSLEGDNSPASGFMYGQMVVFVDFQVPAEAMDVTTYLDNFAFVPVENSTLIYDFETPETSTDFIYFESSLQDQMTTIIDNPAADATNDSPKVLHFIKPANSQPWAGGYAATQPTIDVSTGGQICLDVHMDHIGNIGIKLEQSSTGGPDWIQTVENTKMNEWETLCFDVALPSLEDPMMPASGNIYQQIVVFTDFQMAFGEDENYYLDNFKLVNESTPEEAMVQFSVDMNNESGFSSVELIGEFNNWDAAANPMEDSDGDGVWTTTVTLLNGTYEYKYIVDGGTGSETLQSTDECTRTFDDGQGNVFINRFITVTGDSENLACYGSCYACGDAVSITWNVNMSNETVADTGVYLAGGAAFGHGDFPMSDADGDGVWSITLERQKGFNSDYVFINGLCLPNWECKEQLAGQDCAVGPFNDRNITTTSESEIVINTCFGECSTDGTCGGGPEEFTATFSVDMNGETVAAEGVFIAGGLINNWMGGVTPMDDSDGDGIYTVEIVLPVAIVEYKFINGDAWEELEEGDCTLTDPSGMFINRLLLMEAKDTVVNTHVFASCDVTTDTKELEFDKNLFSLAPSVATDYVDIKWNDRSDKTIQVYSINGQLMERLSIDGSQNDQLLDVSNYTKGMYMVQMTTGDKVGIQRLIVQ